MSDADETARGDEHGDTPAAFACRHLLRGRSCGFHDAHDGLEEGEHDGDQWPTLAVTCASLSSRATANGPTKTRPTWPRLQQRDRAIDQWAFDSESQWFFDADTRVMRFYDEEDNDDAVLAVVVVVGSFSTRSNTWAWVWGNAAYSDAERAKVDPRTRLR